MANETIPVTAPAEPTPPPPSAVPSTIQAIGNLALTVASVLAPQDVLMLAAFRAVLREAPALYTSFVALFTGAPMSAEAKALWDAQIADLMSPEKMLAESKARLQASGVLPPPESNPSPVISNP